nr:type II CAAX endopeptidase family protein [uncultured Caproiciproducens sp.]
MNDSPYYRYNPYYNVSPYVLAQNEKRDLRKISNALCWTLLAAMFLMTESMSVFRIYLEAVGYTQDYSHSGFGGFTPVLYYLASGSGYLVGLAVPVLVFFAARHVSLSNALPFQKTGFLKTAACVFFGSAVCMLANIPANAVVEVEKKFGFTGKMPNYPLTDEPMVLVLYFITIAIIPPLVEELIFRGMILHSLRKYGDSFAIVASAVLFGLYHGNFVQMVFAFIAGLVMALVVVRTNSLWTSILIHLFNNTISVAIEMTQRYGGDQMANVVNNAVVSVVLLLGIASLIYLMVKDRKFFRGDMINPLFRMPSKFSALFFNPGGVAMLIFSAATSVWILTQY